MRVTPTLASLTHATSCPHARNSAAMPLAMWPLTPIEPVWAPPTKLMRQ